MRILVAPDKFKNSLGAREVAESIAAGLRDVLPDATIEMLPVADGGEGTADVICNARGGEWLTCAAHDALERAIKARYVWLRERAMAVMEMSEAAGGRHIAPDERDPLRANTFGVGEMLIDATGRGATEVIVGLGGSVTNDGGFGLARSLGFRFLNRNEVELTGPVSDLLNLEHISPPRDLALPRVTIAADVRNPLLGEHGATRTFGPQKGATPQQMTLLEDALARLADVVSRDLGCDFRETPGAGAAGGLGFGLMSFCAARIRSGFDLIAEIVDLEAAIRRADIVITGEGHLDRQTLEGKAPAGVAAIARRHGKRVFAIVGRASGDQQVLHLFDRLYELRQPGMTEQESIARARDLLRERACELASEIKRETAVE
jgi:glycerate 2-kinase